MVSGRIENIDKEIPAPISRASLENKKLIYRYSEITHILVEYLQIDKNIRM